MDSSEHLYRSIGKLVRGERLKLGLTQDELAQRVGLTRTSINNIEHGRQKIQVHTLYTIAAMLFVPVNALLPRGGRQELEVIEISLDQNYLPAEREWIKRVITAEGGA